MWLQSLRLDTSVLVRHLAWLSLAGLGESPIRASSQILFLVLVSAVDTVENPSLHWCE